jgi:TonB family protein
MSGAFVFSNNSSYGVFELQRLYQKNYGFGLIIAVIIHLAVLIIYFVFGVEQNSISPNVVQTIRTIEWKNFEAPSFEKYIPQNGAQISNTKLKDGIPVPSTDKCVEQDATILSNIERRSQNSSTDLLKSNEVIELTGQPGDPVAPPSKLPEIDDFVHVENIPVMVVAPIPEYPMVAIKAGISGIVYVKVLIDKDGKVIRAVVIKSVSELLNQAAIDAALKSSFIPALQNNNPVAVWMVVPYRFNLRDQ